MAKKTKKENYRSRVHNLLLYTEDPTHVDAMETIKQSYDHACILHDKDLDANGQFKKPHYHFVVRFTCARWKTAVAKELGITENYVEECKNVNNSLMYLLHYNDSDKYQYSIDEVQGPLKSKLQQLINSNGKGESEKVLEIIDFIEMTDNYISIRYLSRWCNENGYWSEFRRNYSIIRDIVNEHNYRFIQRG